MKGGLLASFFLTICACWVAKVAGLTGTQNEPFPLTSQTLDANCTEIIQTHEISGSCCSLQDYPAGNTLGCALTVVDGKCTITGEIWYIRFTSTDPTGTCPDSQYALTDPPTAAPVSVPTISPSPTVTPASGAMVVGTATTFVVALFGLVHLV
eukprot:Nitzschia sp. Nitz4//scaffold49_size126201//100822//101395//NITZ4_003658-RA/size126201-augustus-gene-0.13-mRNA-1//-1//CDS//3329553197//2320//frame0